MSNDFSRSGFELIPMERCSKIYWSDTFEKVEPAKLTKDGETTVIRPAKIVADKLKRASEKRGRKFNIIQRADRFWERSHNRKERWRRSERTAVENMDDALAQWRAKNKPVE